MYCVFMEIWFRNGWSGFSMVWGVWSVCGGFSFGVGGVIFGVGGMECVWSFCLFGCIY